MSETNNEDITKQAIAAIAKSMSECLTFAQLEFISLMTYPELQFMLSISANHMRTKPLDKPK